jgi:hypothetical protein
MAHLPPYAVPLFVRLLPQQETTGTFKHMKNTYRTQGIDPKYVRTCLKRSIKYSMRRKRI